MNINEIIVYWKQGADDAHKSDQCLLLAKRYHHCLFFCHLAIEKLMKALVVKKTKKQAPYGHNLLRLAEHLSINFPEEQLELLAEITSFNIEARYNDYKRRFYKKATARYTQEYFKKIKTLFLWLKRKL